MSEQSADNQNTDNMEYEVITLAAALGIISFDDDVKYTKELGQEVKDKLLEEFGVKLPHGTFKPDDFTEKATATLSASLVAANPKLDVQKVGVTLNDAIRDLDINIKAMDDDLAGKAPANAAPLAAASSVPEAKVADTIKPDESVKRLEQALQQIVPTLNSLDKNEVGIDISAKQTISAPGTVDGFFDAKTQGSFQGAMEHLNYLAELTKAAPAPGATILEMSAALLEVSKVSKDQPNKFVPANADVIKEILVDGVEKAIVEKNVELQKLEQSNDGEGVLRISKEINELTEQGKSIPGLIDDIATLQTDGKLSTPVDGKIPVQAAPASPQPQIPAAKSDEEVIAAAKASGTAAVAKIQTGDINRDIQTVEGVLLALGGEIKDFDKMGLSASVITPLSQSDLDDTDAKGNEVFGANSQDIFTKAIVLIKTLGGEKNPNGVYSHAVGEKLKFQILTNPALEPIRQIEGLNIEKMDPKLAQAYLKGLPKDANAEQIAERQKFESDHNLGGLNSFMGSLDRLQAAGKLDPDKKAREANATNLIMDGLHKMMPAGMMNSIKEFFLNTEIGQMIGSLLSLFGFNMGRLWGDKDDAAGIERAKPAIETGFDSFYKGAQDKLGAEASFKEVMSETKANMMEKLDNGNWAFDKAMDLVFKGKGDEFIKDVVGKAMDAATAAGPTGAKAAFSQYIVDAGQKYQNGQNLDITQINTLLSKAGETIDAAVKARPDLVIGANGTNGTNNSGINNNDASLIAVGTELISTDDGKQNIEMFYNRNTEVYQQEPMRFSPEMVAAMSGVMHRNHDELGLTVASQSLRNNDGSYLEMMTPDFNATVEELLVRAQIDEITLGGSKEITAEQLKNLDHQLTADNIEMVGAYMVGEGVSHADTLAFTSSFAALSTDMRSTKDGSLQDISVWKQSQLPPQLKLDVSQFVPQMKPATDMNGDNPLRDQYLEHNKDRPCEVPLFIRTDGNISVIIRDQHGTKSQTDDEFIKMNLGDYEGARARDIPNHVTRALLGNYKWENANEAGIRMHIDKIFCLDPADPKVVPEVANAFAKANYVPDSDHKNPNDFNGLRTLEKGSELEQFVKKAFDDKGIDIGQKIESSFTNNSQYILVELEQHGIEHEDIDVIVALRHNGKTHYAYVDYIDDNIKPISDQREQGVSDMAFRGNTSARRLDDVLAMIKDNPASGLKDIQGPAGGYMSMLSIVPNVLGGVHALNSMEAVYGKIAVNSDLGARQVLNIYRDGGNSPPPPSASPARSPAGHTTESNGREVASGDNGTCGRTFTDFGKNGPPVIGFLLNNWGDIIGKAIGEGSCNDRREQEIQQQMNDTGVSPERNGKPYSPAHDSPESKDTHEDDNKYHNSTHDNGFFVS